jgi:hypothetical protein
MRLESGPDGRNPVLVVTQPRYSSLRENGWVWAQVNVVRYDLEVVFGQSVFIAWDEI